MIKCYCDRCKQEVSKNIGTIYIAKNKPKSSLARDSDRIFYGNLCDKCESELLIFLSGEDK
jgi:hypothetical protein